MNKNNENKRTPIQWCIMFLTAFILGIISFYLVTWYIFRPDILATHQVGMKILANLGEKGLKLKAYYPVIAFIIPNLVMFIWWLLPNHNTQENYGNARFATRKDFKEMGISHDTGLILGTLMEKDFKGNIKSYELLRASKPLSTLVVAPPGRGKTAGIIIPNLLTIPNSSVVFDIKGELLQKTAGYRQKNFGNEIQVFSPFSWDNTLFFNPFDKTIVEKMEYIQIKKLADQIASTIFVGEKGKENDHWIVSAKTMFVFFAEYFMQKNKTTTLGELSQAPKLDYFKYLNDEYKKNAMKEIEEEDVEKQKIVKKMVRDESVDCFKIWLQQTAFDKEIDDNTRNQARTYQTAAEQEFASVKSTYDTFMKVCSNPQVANAVSKMSFTFDDLREKRLSLYVVIQTEDMEILAPLVRIFTETLFKTLMSGKENSDPNKFIYCFLDEFVRFGKMPFLLEAPALCRSYGLLPVFVTQSYEQIKKYYGEDDLGIIRANAGYQVVFGMNTTKDAKELSELIGDFTRQKTSTSQGNLELFKQNLSKSKEAYKLVTDQDIKNQSSEDLLVLVGGFVNRPIQAKVPYWFKNPAWRGADKVELEKIEKQKENKEQDAQNQGSNENKEIKNSNQSQENINNMAENKEEPINNLETIQDIWIKAE